MQLSMIVLHLWIQPAAAMKRLWPWVGLVLYEKYRVCDLAQTARQISTLATLEEI
jgi:hypothetical protein